MLQEIENGDSVLKWVGMNEEPIMTITLSGQIVSMSDQLPFIEIE